MVYYLNQYTLTFATSIAGTRDANNNNILHNECAIDPKLASYRAAYVQHSCALTTRQE